MKAIYICILLLLTLITPTEVAAQKSSVSAAMVIPVTTGNTFLSAYDGVLGVELSYNHRLARRLYARPALEWEQYYWDRGDAAASVRVNAYSAYMGLSFEAIRYYSVDLEIQVGLGYTQMIFDVERGQDVADGDKRGLSGFIQISPQFYLSRGVAVGPVASYRMTVLRKPDPPIINSDYNRRLYALRFGFLWTYDF